MLRQQRVLAGAIGQNVSWRRPHTHYHAWIRPHKRTYLDDPTIRRPPTRIDASVELTQVRVDRLGVTPPHCIAYRLPERHSPPFTRRPHEVIQVCLDPHRQTMPLAQHANRHGTAALHGLLKGIVQTVSTPWVWVNPHTVGINCLWRLVRHSCHRWGAGRAIAPGTTHVSTGCGDRRLARCLGRALRVTSTKDPPTHIA